MGSGGRGKPRREVKKAGQDIAALGQREGDRQQAGRIVLLPQLPAGGGGAQRPPPPAPLGRKRRLPAWVGRALPCIGHTQQGTLTSCVQMTGILLQPFYSIYFKNGIICIKKGNKQYFL